MPPSGETALWLPVSESLGEGPVVKSGIAVWLLKSRSGGPCPVMLGIPGVRTARLDATDPEEACAFLEVQPEFDLVMATTSAPRCESAAHMLTRDGGRICFFSTVTDFRRACLGAEGIGKDLEMRIGSGYCAGHVRYTLDLMERHPALLRWFKEGRGSFPVPVRLPVGLQARAG